MADDQAPNATKIANRLRLIQVDLADETADVRQQYLEDELRNALRDLSPDQRLAFLEELDQRFPTWDANVPASAESEQQVGQGKRDQAELQDPSFLVERLVELAPTMSEAQRQAVGKRLHEAGLTGPVSQGDWPEEAAGELHKALGLNHEESLDATRSLELAAQLADQAARIDQLVWNTWREIGFRSNIRRETPLPKVMNRYAAGDRRVDRSTLSAELERTRRLTASMVAAIGHIGRQFFHEWLSKLAPSEIEAIVRAEGRSLLKAEGVQCWEKYKQLMADFDEVTVDREVKQIIARHAESLMTGVDR